MNGLRIAGLSALLFAVGVGASKVPALPSFVQYHEDSNFWVYQVTEIVGDEYYGFSKQYDDFPNVYFEKADIRAGQEVKVGDWVVTVFEHDTVAEVVKINEAEGTDGYTTKH